MQKDLVLLMNKRWDAPELDWKTVHASLPEDQKKMMGEWMKDNCPKCPVYGNHQSEIDTKISAIT